ncbi:MAG: ATP-binding protein [Cyanobacteriota bacterium]|nr:ATP-binding protein [Cyanobacteriota bacterium]
MKQLSHLTLSSTLADLPTHDFKVDANTIGEEIETTFHRDPNLPGAIVTLNDRPIGILPRAKFFEWLSLPYGIELYLKRPIRVLLEAIRQDLKRHLQTLKVDAEINAYLGHCLFLSQTSSIHQAVEIALGRPTLLAYEPIVVASANGQWQLLDMYVLLQAQSQLFELAKDAANAANQAKSDFLASMSHELRTPLNAILGFTQIMDRDPNLSPAHQQHIDIIYRAGEHLLELIGDVLDMSKIESGRTTLNPTDCDLYRSIDNLYEMLQLKAAKKGLNLSVEYQGNVPQFLRVDVGKLRQILINLLGNAIKFTPAGCVTLRISAGDGGLSHPSPNPSSNAQPQTLHFEIEDTGVGIAPEEMDRLFTPFGQTEAGRNSGTGTGLGLAIAQNFVRLMGGEIRAHSTLGQGTTFSFNIEIDAVPEAIALAPSPTQRAIALAPDLPEYRILVADDRPEGRLVLVELLEGLGFSVREAENGREAVELQSSYAPHLILMDVRMPVLDGLEATREIKQGEDPSTVVIAITASTFDDERQAIRAVGCDDVINKPFLEETLLEKIAEHLGVRYIYEEKADRQSQSPIDGYSCDRTLQVYLSQMPPNWIEDLHQAALKCRDDKILQLIDLIPESASELANCLKDWANNFLFERVLELIQSDSRIGASGSALKIETFSRSIDSELETPLGTEPQNPQFNELS